MVLFSSFGSLRTIKTVISFSRLIPTLAPGIINRSVKVEGKEKPIFPLSPSSSYKTRSRETHFLLPTFFHASTRNYEDSFFLRWRGKVKLLHVFRDLFQASAATVLKRKRTHFSLPPSSAPRQSKGKEQLGPNFFFTLHMLPTTLPSSFLRRRKNGSWREKPKSLKKIGVPALLSPFFGENKFLHALYVAKRVSKTLPFPCKVGTKSQETRRECLMSIAKRRSDRTEMP